MTTCNAQSSQPQPWTLELPDPSIYELGRVEGTTGAFYVGRNHPSEPNNTWSHAPSADVTVLDPCPHRSLHIGTVYRHETRAEAAALGRGIGDCDVSEIALIHRQH